MSEYLTVSGVTRRVKKEHNIDVPPRIISDLLYQRKLDDGRCPILGGRRLVPRSYLPVIVQVLRDRGLVK